MPHTPAVIAQAAQTQSQAPAGSTTVDLTIGVCQLIENPPIPPLTAFNAMSPATSVWGYLQTVEKLTPAQLTGEMYIAGKAPLLQGVAHGTLVDEGDGYCRYDPTHGYVGTDRATILVKMGGYRVKVIFPFQSGW